MGIWRCAVLVALLAFGASAASAQTTYGDTFSTNTSPSTGGDTFSTNTGPEAGQGPAGDQAYSCFDRAWREARNALQAWQITDIPGWRNPGCSAAAESGPDDLDTCWGPLRAAQSLLQQAAQLFEQARRTPSPQSETINDQANTLVKVAAGLLNKAENCYRPLSARRHSRPGSSPPGPQQAQQQPPLSPQQDQKQPPSGSRPPLASQAENSCRAPPDQNGRFGIANINEADPGWLVTAKILQGWDDCAKHNMVFSLLFLPVTYLTDKYRYLRTLMAIYGYGSTVSQLIDDINAIRQPGQSLGDASYNVGRLLCEGWQLKDIIAKGKLDRSNKNATGKSGSKQTSTTSETDQQGENGTPTKQASKGSEPEEPLPPKGPSNGITALDDMLLRHFAIQNKVILILRDSNAWAQRWINYPNAVAKPMFLKAKSLKPPDNLSALTAAQQAEEAQYAPYYGLASARGLSAAERKAITDHGYVILGKCNGEVITTAHGGYVYSDVDVHGAYDMKGNWVGSNPLLKALNNTLTGRFFQHGAQDDYWGRNDPGSASFGPQPPVTVYYPGGVVHLTTMQQMKDFYLQNGINWSAIYPRPLSSYQAVTGKP